MSEAQPRTEPEILDDQTLLGRLRQDPAQWLPAVLDRYEAPLLRHAGSVLQDDDAAQDVVQESFLRLLRNGRRIRALSAWLHRVTHNLAVDRLRENHVLDETPAHEREAIESHLTTCQQCAAELEELRRTIRLTTEASAGGAAVRLSSERQRQLQEQAARPVPRTRLWLRPAFLATAAALVVMAAVSALLTPSLMRTRIALPQPHVTLATPQAPAPPHPTMLPLARNSTAKAGSPAPSAIDELHAPGYMAPKAGVPSGVEGGVVGGVVGGVAGGVVGGVVGGIGEFHFYDAPLRPPGGALAHDMLFEHAGTNPFVQTQEDALSTFGLDVDTASYAIVRNYVQRGALPPPAAVRVEEFVNAFPQDYPANREGTFAIHVEGAPNPFHRGYHLVRIGLKAREVPDRERRRAHLTFVIDVSGSMGMENRLGLVKRSLRLLVERLDERDRIGIVVYGTRGRVVLESTQLSTPDEILAAIDDLEPEGSTNLEEGLTLGFAMAMRAFDPMASNRVVLCTDGVANNGVTDARTLLQQIRDRAEKGIAMTALGFGMGNYNDVLLQKLADEGDGQYAYIDDFREARSFFLRSLTGVLELVARDAKAQVEFDPVAVERYRLIGYEKRDLPDQAFRDDSVDGGEVNSGHTVTVLYELKLAEGASRAGEVRVRWTDPQSGAVAEISRGIEASHFAQRFDRASPHFRLAAVVARFAEHLRKSSWVKGEPLEKVLDTSELLPRDLLQQPEVAEFVTLVRRTVSLSDDVRSPRHPED